MRILQKLLTICWTLGTVEPSTITTTKINENPGLLPQKLGTAQNIIDYWTFIRVFDLQDLIQEFQLIKDITSHINSGFPKHGPNSSKDMKNYLHIMDQQLHEIEDKLTQLFPTLILTRIKRGLINVLGSFVKVITGNLDAEDGQRYEDAIQKIQGQQNKQKMLLDEQISLTTKAIEKFNSTIHTLARNQLTIQLKLEQLEGAIRKQITSYAETYERMNMNAVFTQLIATTNMILRILEDLETATTFAKIAVLHPSIIEADDFLEELQNISHHLNEAVLPYIPNRENIIIFEKITTIKAYQKETKLVFILEVPVAEPNDYTYYHLYSLPIETKPNLYQIIVPENKFLFLNEHHYIFSNEPCQEAIPGEALCTLPEANPADAQSPCEVHLIRFTQTYENCHPEPIKLRDKKIQKINSNQWIAIFPNETTASSECNNEEETSSLKGTYVIEIPETCKLKVDTTILQTHKNPNIETKVLKVPHLDIKPEENLLKNIEETPPFRLESLNLDDLKSIQNQMDHVRDKLQEEEPIVSSGISLWTIFLYIVMICLATYLISVHLMKKLGPPRRTRQDPDTENRCIPIEDLRIRNQV
ncbi:uncharacterized protein [Leptinotarsa decemlineata]|uniref:uncharacterized protein n=1 Tax=Leptinotarsa decemlineata TaxID=7539 RepID=UPI003D308274